jgi:hypothetical protein
VKSLFAILFSVLLMQLQIAPVMASPVCPLPTTACTAKCCQMKCCLPKPVDSQNAPFAAPTNPQDQISFPALFFVIWDLPENPANSILLNTPSFPTTASVPVYTRNCSFLI